jgi:hypothetical protein
VVHFHGHFDGGPPSLVEELKILGVWLGQTNRVSGPGGVARSACAVLGTRLDVTKHSEPRLT